ncbi:MAG: hypothetical protein ABFS30_17470, partial [Pseudomonadota bacterium]
FADRVGREGRKLQPRLCRRIGSDHALPTGEGEKSASPSVAARRAFGRRMRQRFYGRELGEDVVAPGAFAQSFEDLVTDPPEGLPDEDATSEIAAAGQSVLATHGYEQYEVSAYARNGQCCRHNLNYWSFGDYLAVGAWAHGKVTMPEGVFRYARPANPLSYMHHIEAGEEPAFVAPLTEDELVFEFMLNALRLSAGFDESLFEARTGLPGDSLLAAAGSALERELLAHDPAGRWRPTALGRRFLDDLQAEFLPDRGAIGPRGAAG